MKMLRGKAPLTSLAASGLTPGRLLYRGGLADPATVSQAEQERLVREGFLEWVEADGEGWKLTDADGDEAVLVGDPHRPGDGDPADPGVVNVPAERPDLNDLPAPPADPGTLNEPKPVDDEASAEERRAAARAKLPEDGSAPKGSASQEVWAEYAVAQGYDRAEVEKASRDDLRALFAK